MMPYAGIVRGRFPKATWCLTGAKIKAELDKLDQGGDPAKILQHNSE